MDDVDSSTDKENPRRRGWTIPIVVFLVLATIIGFAGFVTAVRMKIVDAPYLPPDVLAAINAEYFGYRVEQEPAVFRPEPDTKWMTDLAPEAAAALFAARAQGEFAFVRVPRISPDAICAVMNMTGLADAEWAPDPVIPAEWTCFTSVVSIDGGGEEASSTVFGILRGRHRGVADILRITVVAGGATATNEARATAARVMDAILKQTSLEPPSGFLEAVKAGTPFAVDTADYRFTVTTPPGSTRSDAIVMALSPAGFLPTDWFSGRIPRMPGDPILEDDPAFLDDDLATEEEAIPGFGAPLEGAAELPPGFEIEDGENSFPPTPGVDNPATGEPATSDAEESVRPDGPEALGTPIESTGE